MGVGQNGHMGFIDPTDPRPEELWSWAYHPEGTSFESLPAEWDLLIADDALAPTLFDLAMDSGCPARRFALHCMYIYAADGVRRPVNRRRKRKLHRYVQRAHELGDEQMTIWAHNCTMLMNHPELFDYHDWVEAGLVRNPRRLSPPPR